MVRTPHNLRRVLPNFKKDNFFIIGLFAKGNGKTLGLLRGIFFLSVFAISFHFLIWKPFFGHLLEH